MYRRKYQLSDSLLGDIMSSVSYANDLLVIPLDQGRSLDKEELIEYINAVPMICIRCRQKVRGRKQNNRPNRRRGNSRQRERYSTLVQEPGGSLLSSVSYANDLLTIPLDHGRLLRSQSC